MDSYFYFNRGGGDGEMEERDNINLISQFRSHLIY